MGEVSARVIVSNPADGHRRCEDRFLAGAGATDSIVPRQHLEAIGLAPKAKPTYAPLDGSDVTLGLAVARIELMGELVGGAVMFRHPNTESLLSAAALTSLGIEVDPPSQQLKKLSAWRIARADAARRPLSNDGRAISR